MTDWNTARIPESKCPSCGHVLDAATGSEGAPPSPGDLTICIECGTALTFTETLVPRKMRSEDFAVLNPDEAAELRRVQTVVRSYNKAQREKSRA